MSAKAKVPTPLEEADVFLIALTRGERVARLIALMYGSLTADRQTSTSRSPEPDV